MEAGDTFRSRCLGRHFVLGLLVRAHLDLRIVTHQHWHQLLIQIWGQLWAVPTGAEPWLHLTSTSALKYNFNYKFAIFVF